MLKKGKIYTYVFAFICIDFPWPGTQETGNSGCFRERALEGWVSGVGGRVTFHGLLFFATVLFLIVHTHYFINEKQQKINK